MLIRYSVPWNILFLYGINSIVKEDGMSSSVRPSAFDKKAAFGEEVAKAHGTNTVGHSPTRVHSAQFPVAGHERG